MRSQSIPVFYDEESYASTQYATTIQGMRSAATKYGVQLELISNTSFEDTDFDSLAPVSILTGASQPFLQRAILRLREADRRIVLAGTDSEQFGHDISCATPSRRTETQQLVNYLYGCGKERIALVGFGQNSINDNFRLHAAMSAVAAWGRLLTEENVWLWQQDPRVSFERFLTVHDRYDAVICPNDVMAICFVECCKTHGINVPQSLFVASFGDMAIGRFYRPSITSMTMDMRCVGEQAFNVWRFLMNNESAQRTALKITVPSRILVRESTGGVSIKTGEGPVMPGLQADRFYSDPTIAVMVSIEHCIARRDAIDMRIMKNIMEGHSYEQISDDLFISGSTLRYRLKKIYADAGVRKRDAFEALMRKHLGSDNPFVAL